ATQTYILIHVFGTVRDELDRADRGKRTYSGWLREYVADTPQRLTEIARLLDLLTENGWKVVGSPYDCDVMLEREVSRDQAEQELRRADYWEFVDLITVRKQARKSFEDFLALYHWTELIQSSPLAVEQSVYEVIGGAYRKANITTLELRYNPMKRNRGGERDLDHIIMASIRGLDRALLEYPVKCGLIFCLDRTFNYALNEIILEKAIAY